MAVGSGPDATEANRRLKALVHAQARVLELVGQNAPLEKVLQELADLFQEQIKGSVASILLTNADATALVVADAPNLDPAFDMAATELPIEHGARTCGHAAYLGDAVITSDVDTDPNWTAEDRAGARAVGVRACWAVPVLGADGSTLGVFAAYWSEPTTPSDHDLWVQHQFARLTQIAIERAQTVDRITALLAEERRRIAGDIHDDPIQAITAVSLRLQRLAATASKDQQELLADAQTAVKGAIERLRHMLFELHPPTLEEDGLAAAVEAYLAESFDDPVTCALDDDLHGDIPPAIAALAYRLTREALSNVANHAHATQVEVTLSDEDGGLVVRVRDNGVGFDAGSAYREEPGHMGLTNCRYLAQRALGWWNISSAPGATAVEFFLPTRVP